MSNDPLTFTISVPQGNVSPKARAMTPEHQKRAIPPSALPAAIQK
jgi:hypothetical protein